MNPVLDTMASPHASLLRAYEAAGHTVAARRDRNGSWRVSLDGARETFMGVALRRVEHTLTAERAWPWQRAA